MPTATFKTLIKYRGKYYTPNEPFLISNTDVDYLRNLGAAIKLVEKEENIEAYLKMSISKLKTAINEETSLELIKLLLEQDLREMAKTIYTARLNKLG